jgi:hypothetical protein
MESKRGTEVKLLENQFGRIVLQPITEKYFDMLWAFLQTG